MYDRHGNPSPAPAAFAKATRAPSPDGIPPTASRGTIILSGCSRLERLRYAAEQAILDWRDAADHVKPAMLLTVRAAQTQISRAKYRNAHIAGEMSARTWVDNWEPRRSER